MDDDGPTEDRFANKGARAGWRRLDHARIRDQTVALLHNIFLPADWAEFDRRFELARSSLLDRLKVSVNVGCQEPRHSSRISVPEG